MVQIVTAVCHACHAFHAIDSPNGGSRDSGDVVPIVSYIYPPNTPGVRGDANNNWTYERELLNLLKLVKSKIMVGN